jgi:transcriptional activator for dhaKLM operon
LIINELLGYDESLGHGQLGSRPSKFELAQMGTLFFQDVDTLPLEAQSVLLNVLELGIIQRLGSQRPIEVNIRVIASTSARMENLLAQGSFRPALYYRLSTFAITIPPLRERNRDIPLVVERILRRLSRQMDYSLTLGPGVLDALKRYPWPGNVREIESVLGRAVTQVGQNGIIEFGHLPNTIRFVNHISPSDQALPDIQSLSEVERETIMRTAQLCRGNITRMAQALGIGRTTLWRNLKKLEIEIGDYR